MSKKQVVEKYIEGFRSGDQSKVLACLCEDVVWRLHGCQTLNGKKAVEADIMNEEFNNGPQLEIRQFIEEENRIVAVGSGSMLDNSRTKPFVFCEVFVFQDELIREIDTFHIWTDC